MSLIATALVGAFFGAVGTEILRLRKPGLFKRVEASAKRFVDRLDSSTTDATEQAAADDEEEAAAEQGQEETGEATDRLPS